MHSNRMIVKPLFSINKKTDDKFWEYVKKITANINLVILHQDMDGKTNGKSKILLMLEA